MEREEEEISWKKIVLTNFVTSSPAANVLMKQSSKHIIVMHLQITSRDCLICESLRRPRQAIKNEKHFMSINFFVRKSARQNFAASQSNMFWQMNKKWKWKRKKKCLEKMWRQYCNAQFPLWSWFGRKLFGCCSPASLGAMAKWASPPF